MVNTHQAKTKLSSLLADIEEKGETVIICRNGNPVAELHRYQKGPGSLWTVHEELKPVYLAKDFDPVKPLPLDDWPETCR